MPDTKTGASILDKCMLFSTLSTEERNALTAHAYRRRYKAGARIFSVGDPGDTLMAVLSGTVRISLPTATGRELILSDLMEGEIFGEIALLDGGGRSADAAALTSVELLCVSRIDTMKFLAGNPDACLRLLGLVCSRLRVSDERMSDIASIELGARLAKTMLRQIDRQNEVRLRISLSQSELARMIGGTREGVNRQLKKWEQAGLVEVDRGSIVVRRRVGLAAIAGLI